MFDRFTEDARKALGQARQASIRLGHGYIDGGHILLGLLEVPGRHHEVFAKAGRSTPEVKLAVEKRAGTGLRTSQFGQLPFTPGSKEVLVATAAAAHHEIRPEHLLLGMLIEEDELGGQVLRDLGITLPIAHAVLAEEEEPAAPETLTPASDIPGLAAQVFDVLVALRESKRAQETQARRLEALETTLRRVWIAGIAVATTSAGLGAVAFLR